jgi:hypothetical protein
MTKKKFILMTLMMVMLPLSGVQVSAASTPIPLTGGYVDPTAGHDYPRTIIGVPQIEIEDYTLFFISPCDGSELRLVDENSNVVYTTIIPVNATSLVLPSYLSGDYVIQIIQGQYYFWGFIEL